MLWYWAIIVYTAWGLVVLGIAVRVCRTHRRASRNPLAWIPLFLAGPLIFVLLSGVFALLVPISLVGVVIALVALPFSKSSKVSPEGIIISQWIGGAKEILRWSKISEWKKIETAPFPTHVAILKTGDTMDIPRFACENICEILAERGIPYTVEEE